MAAEQAKPAIAVAGVSPARGDAPGGGRHNITQRVETGGEPIHRGSDSTSLVQRSIRRLRSAALPYLAKS